MRFLPAATLTTIAALTTTPLMSAETGRRQGACTEEPTLLTLSGKVFVYSPNELESPDSVGVFVADNGREMLLSLSDRTLLSQIRKRHGKAITLQGRLVEQGKTFLVQRLLPPDGVPSHSNKES